MTAVRATLNERADNPVLAYQSAKDLSAALNDSNSSPLQRVMTTYARPARIVRSKKVDASWSVDPTLFERREEQQLYDAFHEVEAKVSSSMSFKEFLRTSEQILQPVNEYFDNVFVMCEDEKVQNNRLALLRDVAKLSKGIIDFTQLQGF